jgi:hypothetical protein
MAGKLYSSLADVPISFWRAKFEVKENKLLWRPRPREEFACDRIWRSWNGRFAGKEAGTWTSWHGKPVLTLSVLGLGNNIPADKVKIAFKNRGLA